MLTLAENFKKHCNPLRIFKIYLYMMLEMSFEPIFLNLYRKKPFGKKHSPKKARLSHLYISKMLQRSPKSPNKWVTVDKHRKRFKNFMFILYNVKVIQLGVEGFFPDLYLV